MEKSSERRKALWISGIGAVLIMGFVYSSAWIVSLVLDQALGIQESSRPRTSDSSEVMRQSEAGGLILAVQETAESRPYQFEVITYVATPEQSNSAAAARFNDSVLDYVQTQRNNFESELKDFLGTIQSPQSTLTIRVISIDNPSPDEVIIKYEIERLFEGDTTPSIFPNDLYINL